MVEGGGGGLKPRYAVGSGCAFGARNYPELIVTDSGHCDDVCRTVSYIRAGIQQYCFVGAGFKSPRYGKNPGGLQSSGDRANMMETCERLLPLLEPYASGIRVDHAGLPVVRLLPAATIKRLSRHSRPKVDV
jgi:hypothetical protein